MSSLTMFLHVRPGGGVVIAYEHCVVRVRVGNEDGCRVDRWMTEQRQLLKQCMFGW